MACWDRGGDRCTSRCMGSKKAVVRVVRFQVETNLGPEGNKSGPEHVDLH